VNDRDHSPRYPAYTGHPSYPTATARPIGRGVLIARLKAAEARGADKDTTISEQRAALDDLRHRLNRSEDERARAQAQLTALLANQRAAYRGAWWRWRRWLPELLAEDRGRR